MKKLEVTNNDNYSYLESDNTSIQASIDIEDLSHIFETLSDNYKDPYGSIVRELTSNCIDANVASDKPDEISEIGIKRDENYNKYIYFKDFGNGMSPEFMEKIYMKYGKSTKRNTNNQLGFFGIGSKSPLSIRNEYYIDSIVDGIMYSYIIYKGDNGVPLCEEFNECKEVSADYIGTTVKIYLDYDESSFITAINNQLRYFDRVYFNNIGNKSINDYLIYDYGKFVKSELGNSTYAHINYGRVKYDIDWTLIKMKALEFNIGVKIPIGELMPNSNRETFKYNEDSIALIKHSVISAAKDLYDYYTKTESKQCETISEYVRIYDTKETKRKEYKKLANWLNDYDEFKTEDYNNELIICLEYKKLNLTPKSNIIDFEKFYEYFIEVSTVVRSGKSYSTKKYTRGYALTHNNRIIRVNKDTVKNVMLNKYLDFALLVKRKKFKNRYEIKKYFELVKEYFKDIKKGNYKTISKLVLNHIKENTELYNEIVIPEDFIIAEKLKNQRARMSSDEIKIVRIKRLESNISNTFKNTINQIIDNTREYKRFNGYGKYITKDIYIGSYEQESIIRYILNAGLVNHNTYKFYICSNKNKEMLLSLKHDNILALENFMQGTVMKDYFTAMVLNKKLKENDCDITLSEIMLSPTEDARYIWQKIISFLGNSNTYIPSDKRLSSDKIETLKKEMLDFALVYRIYDEEFIDKSLSIISEINKMKYLKWFKNDIPKQLLADYFKEYGIKVQKEYYTCKDAFSKEETELVLENHRKLVYLRSINKIKHVEKRNNYVYY